MSSSKSLLTSIIILLILCITPYQTAAQSGNVRTMVDGFLNSIEYKLRFGQP